MRYPAKRVLSPEKPSQGPVKVPRLSLRASEKPGLAVAGKGLAGSGLTGIVLYVTGTANRSSWPFWPYWIFIGMLAAGVLLYFAGQRRSAAPDDEGVPHLAEDAARSRSAPAFTGRWRHTVSSDEVPNLKTITRRAFSHGGYQRRPSEAKPPSVRISMAVTCDPLGSAPTTSDLRDNFLSFLRQPPVWKLIRSLTHVGDDLAWRTYASDGRLDNEAVLTCREDQQVAPVASAKMILNETGIPRPGHDPHTAELALHIEPRVEDGSPAPPADFQAWHDSLVRALAVPGAFAHFLRHEVDVLTYDDPPVQIGVQLDAHHSVSELIDPQGLRPVTGSRPSNCFLGFMIAEPAGKQAAEVVEDLLIRICDHALHLQNGYEDKLVRLRHAP
jgi:hypothetical protein